MIRSHGVRRVLAVAMLGLAACVEWAGASNATDYDVTLNIVSSKRTLKLVPGGDSQYAPLILNLTPKSASCPQATVKFTHKFIDGSSSYYTVSYNSSYVVSYSGQVEARIRVKAKSGCPLETAHLDLKADITYPDGSKESKWLSDNGYTIVLNVTEGPDTEPPNLSSPQVSPSSGAKGTTFRISVQGTDNAGIVTVTAQILTPDGRSLSRAMAADGDTKNTTWRYNWTSGSTDPDGTYTLKFECRDKGDNRDTTPPQTSLSIGVPSLAILVSPASPSSIQVGQSIGFTVTISAASGGLLSGAIVSVHDNAGLSGVDQTLPATGSDGKTYYTFKPLDDGTTQLIFSAKKSGYRDTAASVSVTVTLPPVFHDVTVLPLFQIIPSSGIRVGEQVDVVATIKNKGTQTETSIPVKFFVNDVQKDARTIASLTPDQSSVLEFLYTFPSAGKYVVKVETDLAADENDPNDRHSVELGVETPDQAWYHLRVRNEDDDNLDVEWSPTGTWPGNVLNVPAGQERTTAPSVQVSVLGEMGMLMRYNDPDLGVWKVWSASTVIEAGG